MIVESLLRLKIGDRLTEAFATDWLTDRFGNHRQTDIECQYNTGFSMDWQTTIKSKSKWDEFLLFLSHPVHSAVLITLSGHTDIMLLHHHYHSMLHGACLEQTNMVKIFYQWKYFEVSNSKYVTTFEGQGRNWFLPVG